MALGQMITVQSLSVEPLLTAEEVAEERSQGNAGNDQDDRVDGAHQDTCFLVAEVARGKIQAGNGRREHDGTGQDGGQSRPVAAK